MKALKPPHSYWSSPSGSTASIPVSRPTVREAVQSVLVPSPPLNAVDEGSQAISPAAPMIGSGFGCTWTCCVLTASTLPTLSTEKNVKVIGALIVNGLLNTGLDVVGVEPSVVK